MFNSKALHPLLVHQGNVHLRTYSQEEMLAYARSRGCPLSDWTFRDWIKVGLLGAAKTHSWPGRGHGSGSVARWSPQQFVLFQLIVAQKQAFPSESNAPYCNLPIWKWLYWGDQSDVSLEQVKRALQTWQHRYQKNSQKKRSVRKHVRELVSMTASQYAIGTRGLINDLTEMVTAEESLDEAILQEIFALIIDPKGIGEARGLPECEFTPEQLSRRISLQALAAQLDLTALPDSFWELARVCLLLVRQCYQLAQTERESGTNAAKERSLPRASLQALLDSSCFLLLYMLAILQRGPHPNLQENLQPRAWVTGAVRGSIKAESVPMPLFLPNGFPILRLQIEVTLWYKDVPWSFSFTLPYL